MTGGRTRGGLPVSGLLALAMTGFVAIMTETLPAGLLPAMSVGLGVSQSMAGQLVTLYALGSLLAAIPLTVATRGWRRRTALLCAIGGFLVFNTLTAFSTHYGLTLVARFLAGAAAGLAWGLLAGHARRMVLPHQQGRAMTIAMAGTPIALSLGVPLGTWLGAAIGWQAVFGLMSLLTLALIIWVLRRVPDFAGQPSGERRSLGRVFMLPGVRPVLLVIVIWVLAHNILYTYIVPFLAPAGLANRADLILLLFGVSAMAGIYITGLMVDRWLRRAVLSSLTGFALASLALGLAGNQAGIIYAGIALWGLTFGGAATLLQTASADAAGAHADVAQSMIVVAWNLSIAGGGLIGGLVLHGGGAQFLPWIVLVLALAGWSVAWQARRYGFRPGARGATA